MLAAERQERILEELRMKEWVNNEDLALEFDVSVETVRRDVTTLAKTGKIKRVHGGAVLPKMIGISELPFEERTRTAAKQKERIAAATAAMLPEDALIFFDLGTTLAAVAKHVDPDLHATIVTTSIHVAMVLSPLRNIEILIPGGRLRKGDLSLSGSPSLGFLAGLNPDVAVLSTGAVDPTSGITDFDFEECEEKKIVLAKCHKALVVADSSKFGRTAPYQMCAANEPNLIIADQGVPTEMREAMRKAGAELHMV